MSKKFAAEYIPTPEELHRELLATAQELHCAYDRFNYVSDPELVDACIYEIDALKARYDFLLRRIKGCGGDCVAASAMEGGKICPL